METQLLAIALAYHFAKSSPLHNDSDQRIEERCDISAELSQLKQGVLNSANEFTKDNTISNEILMHKYETCGDLHSWYDFGQPAIQHMRQQSYDQLLEFLHLWQRNLTMYILGKHNNTKKFVMRLRVLKELLDQNQAVVDLNDSTILIQICDTVISGTVCEVCARKLDWYSHEESHCLVYEKLGLLVTLLRHAILTIINNQKSRSGIVDACQDQNWRENFALTWATLVAHTAEDHWALKLIAKSMSQIASCPLVEHAYLEMVDKIVEIV